MDCTEYYFRQLVTLADYYDVKPLMKQFAELAIVSTDIPNSEKLLLAIKAKDTELEVIFCFFPCQYSLWPSFSTPFQSSPFRIR